MARKGFGIKELNLITGIGTPTIESPNNLNLSADQVAIRADVSIGGQCMSDFVMGPTYSISAGSITATSTISAGGITSGHHVPAVDNTYDLGSTTKRWNDLHLSGATIYMYEDGGTTTFTRTDINKLKRGETLKGDLSVSATTISAQRTSTTVGLFSNMDTTPDVSTGCLFRTANLGPTSISGFDGGVIGQRMIIIIGDLRTDFIDDDSAASYPLKLQRARDWTTPATNDTIEFVFNGTNWYELTRSDNS